MADITTVWIHVNSIFSTKGASYMTGDIKNFYLSTTMKIFEYAKYHRKNIPQDFIDLNNSEHLFDKTGWIYMEIQ